MKRVLMACASAALASCALMPDPVGTDADYGEPPPSVRPVIDTFLRLNMKDPESVQLGDSYYGPARVAVPVGFSTVYGWGVCFAANAKNSFGGYTGYQVWMVVYRNGAVVANLTQGRTIYEDARINRLCTAMRKT